MSEKRVVISPVCLPTKFPLSLVLLTMYGIKMSEWPDTVKCIMWTLLAIWSVATLAVMFGEKYIKINLEEK